MKTTLLAIGSFFALVISASALTNGVGFKPVMGWNTWYGFVEWYDGSTLTNQVLTMQTNGLIAAGYKYICLDAAWQAEARSNGYPTALTSVFPAGVKSFSDWLHGQGLYFGIYYNGGTNCDIRTPVGSYGYETNDVLWAASQGADLVKFDVSCLHWELWVPSITKVRGAILECGRPMVYNACVGFPNQQAPALANSWRTYTDVNYPDWTKLLAVIDANMMANSISPTEPGYFNDPDFITFGFSGSQWIGNPNPLTTSEKRVYFGMWCMMASPLILGADVTKYSADELAILTSPEVIAIDQDPAGVQCNLLSSSGPTNAALQVYVKPVGVGGLSRAIAFLNRSSDTASMTVDFLAAGLGGTNLIGVRDLWARADLGTFSGSFTTNVAPHDCAIFLLSSKATQPRLAIVSSVTGVMLTWPTNFLGFTLQSSTDLVTWTTNPPAGVVINGENAVSNAVSGLHQFYRLSK
jgi:alpha-galactosidase